MRKREEERRGIWGMGREEGERKNSNDSELKKFEAKREIHI